MGAVSLPMPVRLAAYKGSVSPPSSSHLLFNSMKSELDVLLFSVDQIVLALELVVLRQPRSWQWRQRRVSPQLAVWFSQCQWGELKNLKGKGIVSSFRGAGNSGSLSSLLFAIHFPSGKPEGAKVIYFLLFSCIYFPLPASACSTTNVPKASEVIYFLPLPVAVVLHARRFCLKPSGLYWGCSRHVRK